MRQSFPDPWRKARPACEQYLLSRSFLPPVAVSGPVNTCSPCNFAPASRGSCAQRARLEEFRVEEIRSEETRAHAAALPRLPAHLIFKDLLSHLIPPAKQSRRDCTVQGKIYGGQGMRLTPQAHGLSQRPRRGLWLPDVLVMLASAQPVAPPRQRRVPDRKRPAIRIAGRAASSPAVNPAETRHGSGVRLFRSASCRRGVPL